MTEPVGLALIAMVGTTITSVVGIFMTYIKTRESNQNIKELKITVDGRMQQLLERTDAMARAEGELKGGQDQKNVTAGNVGAAVEVLNVAAVKAVDVLEVARTRAADNLAAPPPITPKGDTP